MKQHRNKIIAGFMILAVLALAFWWGGNPPELKAGNPTSLVTEHTTVPPTSPPAEPPSSSPVLEEEQQFEPGTEAFLKPEQTTDSSSGSPLADNLTENEGAAPENRPANTLSAEEKVELASQATEDALPETIQQDEAYSNGVGMQIDESSGKDQYQTNPVPAGKPVPVEPQSAVVTDKELTCTFSVRCDSILDHLTWLDPKKAGLIPADGVIYEQRTVSFYEGESVFDLLLREMKDHKIHLEFTNTPMNNSAYIEGINNIYEFDCGGLSGWIYKVNGWVPNYGSSRYQLKQGDKVEWVYTCDLGADANGFSR